MRDKKLERQAPLLTRTLRRDGRLIFFSFSPLPCTLQTFFIPLDSYPKSFLLVAVLQRRFCPPRLHSFFLLHGQLHQRPHTLPLFGLLIDSVSNCPPLISNPSLLSLGREIQKAETNTTTIQPQRKKTVRARLVHHRLVSVLRWIRLLIPF